MANGTETSGLEPLWRLDIGSPNARFGVRYEASTESELVAALDSLGESLQSFSFVDLGCGKGRTLLVASRLGFREVIGVEFARELAQVAARNMAATAVRNAVVLHADAAEFTLPGGDAVVYLYNPFSEEVMTKVLSNLRRARGDKLYVLYKGPRCATLLDNSGFLERLDLPSRAPHIQIWRGVRASEGWPAKAHG